MQSMREREREGAGSLDRKRGDLSPKPGLLIPLSLTLTLFFHREILVSPSSQALLILPSAMAVSLRTDWVPMQAPPSKAATAAGAHGQPFHGDLLPHTFSDFPFLDDFLFDEALLGLLLDDPPPPPALLPGSLAGATARPAVAPPTSACPTAQSVAARLRRRRISEKTRELAQLIPGGPRMTTAEMLLAARNYVKFLQAQLGLLGLAGSSSPVRESRPL